MRRGAISALAVFALAGCGGGSGTTTTARGDYVPSVVRRYAPLVYLYRGVSAEERFLPMDADEFIRRSSLRWHYAGACPERDVVPVGKIDPVRLGSGGYFAKQTSKGCLRLGRKFSTADFTRPFSKGNATGKDGFFLDYIGSPLGNPGPQWPMYFEYEPKRYITYWFFYAHNEPIKIGINQARWIVRSHKVDLFGRHEGDWEHVSVHLRDGKAVELALYAHGNAPVPTPWIKVRKDSDTHPIVYSAQGSHASYLDEAFEHPGLCFADIGCIIDPTRKGLPWRTWDSNTLRNARTKPWYDYGGGWGEIGPWFKPETSAGRQKDISGPLGPSQWKTEVAPTGW